MKLPVSKTREPSATRATFTGPGLIWHDTWASPLQYLRAVPSHCRAPARNAKKTQANRKCNKGNQTWETGLNWRGQLGPHNSNCHVPCGLCNFRLYYGALRNDCGHVPQMLGRLRCGAWQLDHPGRGPAVVTPWISSDIVAVCRKTLLPKNT